MSANPHEFWGLTAGAWTAVATFALTAATLALVAVTVILVVLGRRQLLLIREETKLQCTLTVCEKWDTDPVIDQCLHRLAEGWSKKEIFKKPQRYRVDAVTILNFLQSICTGIEAGVYDEPLVRKFHENNINELTDDYFEKGLIEKMGSKRHEYRILLRMHKKWKKEPPAA